MNGARLDRRFEAQFREVEDITAKKTQRSPGELVAWLQQCRQPLLVGLAGNPVLAASCEGPRKHRIPIDDVPVIFAFIKAAVDELDCLRG